MNLKDLKIVFFGTPEFAVESLKALVEAGCNIEAVVTAPDKPAGRGHKMLKSDVKKYAEQANLRLLQPTNLKSPEFISQLKDIDADLFIVIAFRMMPESVWSMPSLGTFNLHASLLPKYRGAAPINRAIINGETETGVTTFFLKHEIDTGDIIESRKVDIAPDENVGHLYDRLMKLGAEMVINTVKDIADGKVKTQPQPDGEFIPAPKIFREDCEIDWNKPAREIHNLIRGLSPYPCARTVIKDSDSNISEIKIISSAISNEEMSGNKPGEIVLSKNKMVVMCGKGSLEILELQPAGKKGMPVSAYLLGHNPIAMGNSGDK